MTEIPDPTSVVTWPSAIVAIALIISMLVVPSILTYLSGQRFKEVRDTLTNTNGGSTVRDSLNRIEEDSAGVREDVASIAVEVGKLRTEFDAHLSTERAGRETQEPALDHEA